MIGGELGELLGRISDMVSAISSASWQPTGDLEKIGDGTLSLQTIADLVARAAELSTEENRSRVAEFAAEVSKWSLAHRNKLAVKNLRLARKWVDGRFSDRLRRARVRCEDATQNCVIAMLRGAELYDYSSGVRFSTYVTRWIWQAIHRTILRSSLIHTPSYLTSVSDDVANAFEGKRRVNRRAVEAARMIHLLDKDEEAEVVIDKRASEHSERTAARLDVKHFLTKLRPLERRILELRYMEELGYKDIASRLYEEGVADRVVSRQRVLQVENRVLGKLRTLAEKSR